MDYGVGLALALAASAVLAVLAALFLAALFERVAAAGGLAQKAQGPAATFLVSEGRLIDANEQGLALLAALTPPESAANEGDAVSGDRARQAWLALSAYLTERFPGFDARSVSARLGAWSVMGARDSVGAGLVLEVAARPDSTRLTLRAVPAEANGSAEDIVRVDLFAWRALNDELASLRQAVDLAPIPSWREARDGRITWANGAYLKLLAACGYAEPIAWPLPPLFPTDRATITSRVSITPRGETRVRWFDLVVVEDEGGRLCHAIPADEAHRAEMARRAFMQTFARTFATLPIGLAVFDRTRRLQLFNPALSDLTELEPEFLAARPSLEGMFNRMREKRIMPEPRDFRRWLERLLELEAGGAGKGFEEIWTLPDGRSYRISAASHPDGALALLIQDITTDMRLKRSFRAELEALRTALDLVSEGVVVFSNKGDLVLANSAFEDIWAVEGDDSLAGITFAQAIADWRRAGGTADLWDRIAALSAPGGRGEVTGLIAETDDETLFVRARRGANGCVIVSFSPVVPSVALGRGGRAGLEQTTTEARTAPGVRRSKPEMSPKVGDMAAPAPTAHPSGNPQADRRHAAGDVLAEHSRSDGFSQAVDNAQREGEMPANVNPRYAPRWAVSR